MSIPIIPNYVLNDQWEILSIPVWLPIFIEVVFKTFLKCRVLAFLFEKPTIFIFISSGKKPSCFSILESIVNKLGTVAHCVPVPDITRQSRLCRKINRLLCVMVLVFPKTRILLYWNVPSTKKWPPPYKWSPFMEMSVLRGNDPLSLVRRIKVLGANSKFP